MVRLIVLKMSLLLMISLMVGPEAQAQMIQGQIDQKPSVDALRSPEDVKSQPVNKKYFPIENPKIPEIKKIENKSLKPASNFIQLKTQPKTQESKKTPVLFKASSTTTSDTETPDTVPTTTTPTATSSSDSTTPPTPTATTGSTPSSSDTDPTTPPMPTATTGDTTPTTDPTVTDETETQPQRECVSGQMESCSEADYEQACAVGERTCQADGTWGACTARVRDQDGDGVSDCDDGCPDNPYKSEPGRCGCNMSDSQDPDQDGVCGSADNCPDTANSAQADRDADGIGDACDTPECGNEIVETGEACDDGNNVSGDGCQADCKEASECFTGNTQGCLVDGAKGVCQTGKQVCENGKWGQCVSKAKPSKDICDGLDNDCDGDVDEDFNEVVTSCGVGACRDQGLKKCLEGQVVNTCQAKDPGSDPDLCDGIDNDCDGTVDENHEIETSQCGVGACGASGEKLCINGSVTDTCQAATGSTGPDLCDGLDNDCDGEIDEDFQEESVSCGVGECQNQGIKKCEGGMIVNTCQAKDPATGPDLCDGKDNDCDGQADEDYQPTSSECGVGACSATGSKICVNGAITDTCEASSASSSEDLCDGIDNDCDGQIDEDHQETMTSCGVGACLDEGRNKCIDGAIVNTCQAKTPGSDPDLCDGVDNDCDGTIDEDYQAKATSCGQGVCAASGQEICEDGKITDTCQIGSSLSEVDMCDGLDNDCDGSVDEDFKEEVTSCGLGACSDQGNKKCVEGQIVDTCQAKTPGSDPDLCDGIDNDCDGKIDEDYLPTSSQCGVGACTATGSKICVQGSITDTCEASTASSSQDLCDGIDNDCDGQIDEDHQETLTSCGVGACLDEGRNKCIDGAIVNTCQAKTPGSDPDLCDGIDNDCDGTVDEDYVGETTQCGVGSCSASGEKLCINGSVTDTCQAATGSTGPDLCDGLDNDCDGQVDEDFNEVVTSCGVGACRDQGLKKCLEGQIVDTCQSKTPSSDPDLCDGIDNDCDGQIDEAYQTISSECGVGACSATGSKICVNGAVTDTCEASSSSSSEDLCDGIDNDCDGQIDEDHQETTTSCGVGACLDEGRNKCIDGAIVNTCQAKTPGSDPDLCDGVDNDCDGTIDEDYQAKATSCGQGVCAASGQEICDNGSLVDTCQEGSPLSGDDICDGQDSDCDGQVDEDFQSTKTECGTGVCQSKGQETCVDGRVLDSCQAMKAPNKPDLCDGVDNDCDGEIDEDFQSQSITCGVGACQANGYTACSGEVIQNCDAGLPQTEICDGIDNDCNGTIDDGFDTADSDYDGIPNCKDSPDCGNGLIEEGEECDDNNRKDSDGCSAQCQSEAVSCMIGCFPANLQAGETGYCGVTHTYGDNAQGPKSYHGFFQSSSYTYKCFMTNEVTGEVTDLEVGSDLSFTELAQKYQSDDVLEVMTSHEGLFKYRFKSKSEPLYQPMDTSLFKSMGDDIKKQDSTSPLYPTDVLTHDTTITCQIITGETTSDECDVTLTVTQPTCGNGVKEFGETCDDGNVITEDCNYGASGCEVCNDKCQLTQGQTSFCGDGIVQTGEECDDANTNEVDGCTSSCLIKKCEREICDGKDNDCDGEIDEGDLVEEGKICQTGLDGLCSQGISVCDKGQVICKSNYSPTAEICSADNKDEDCKEGINNGCECIDGQTQSCYDGLASPGVGTCKAGTQECVGGRWTECAGQIGPAIEVCDGQDNDCNGTIDDADACQKPEDKKDCQGLACNIANIQKDPCEVDPKAKGCVVKEDKEEVDEPEPYLCRGLIDANTDEPSLICHDIITKEVVVEITGVSDPAGIINIGHDLAFYDAANNIYGLTREGKLYRIATNHSFSQIKSLAYQPSTHSLFVMDGDKLSQVKLASDEINTVLSIPSFKAMTHDGNDRIFVLYADNSGTLHIMRVEKQADSDQLITEGFSDIAKQSAKGKMVPEGLSSDGQTLYVWDDEGMEVMPIDIATGKIGLKRHMVLKKAPAALKLDNQARRADHPSYVAAYPGLKRIFFFRPDHQKVYQWKDALKEQEQQAVHDNEVSLIWLLNQLPIAEAVAEEADDQTFISSDNVTGVALIDFVPMKLKLELDCMGDLALDEDGDGVRVCDGDCDDNNAAIFPEAEEACDGVDNNCNAVIDEGCPCVDGDEIECGSNVGACESGVQVCEAGELSATCEGQKGPTAEICDGLDNDCDGEVDESYQPKQISCGVGECQRTVSTSCEAGAETTPECIPGDPSEKVCNGLDNDCDGVIDGGCLDLAPDVGDTEGAAANEATTGPQMHLAGGSVFGCSLSVQDRPVNFNFVFLFLVMAVPFLGMVKRRQSLKISSKQP